MPANKLFHGTAPAAQPLNKALYLLHRGPCLSTFRRTSLKNKVNLLSALPMINDENWNESLLLSSRCVSIWDKWLFETDTPNALNDATIEQEAEWQSYFDQFHVSILNNFSVYMRANRKGIFKEVVDNESAVEKLSNCLFEFLIPEISTIYSVGFDFTAHIYFRDFDVAKGLFELVKESKLKFLNDQCSQI
ncbi:hypothetical protein EOPP23_20965 [Endozoicomonas sp. OPT23]|nr:hypothetical protein [Endozoicomonas sp. OPT23]